MTRVKFYAKPTGRYPFTVTHAEVITEDGGLTIADAEKMCARWQKLSGLPFIIPTCENCAEPTAANIRCGLCVGPQSEKSLWHAQKTVL